MNYSLDTGGMILWIPIFLLVGIVYAMRKGLKRFGVSTGDWSSFDLVWFGIEMILGFGIAALFAMAFIYGGMKSISEYKKMLNNDWEIDWWVAGFGLFFWYMVIGTLVLWLRGIYKFVRSKFNQH